MLPDCAVITWTRHTSSNYPGLRLRRVDDENNWRTLVDSGSDSRTEYRDCGHGYGDLTDGDDRLFYVYHFEARSSPTNLANRATSEVMRYRAQRPAREPFNGPADHLRAQQPDHPVGRSPSEHLAVEMGLRGETVPVADPWINGYQVDRREFTQTIPAALGTAGSPWVHTRYDPQPGGTWATDLTVGVRCTRGPLVAL